MEPLATPGSSAPEKATATMQAHARPAWPLNKTLMQRSTTWGKGQASSSVHLSVCAICERASMFGGSPGA